MLIYKAGLKACLLLRLTIVGTDTFIGSEHRGPSREMMRGGPGPSRQSRGPPRGQMSQRGGPRDMGPRDMGPRDMGPRDMGPRDMGPRDMGPRDMGPRDMGPRDMGPRDMGPRDMGPRDMGPREMRSRDMRSRDMGGQMDMPPWVRNRQRGDGPPMSKQIAGFIVSETKVTLAVNITHYQSFCIVY